MSQSRAPTRHCRRSEASSHPDGLPCLRRDRLCCALPPRPIPITSGSPAVRVAASGAARGWSVRGEGVPPLRGQAILALLGLVAKGSTRPKNKGKMPSPRGRPSSRPEAGLGDATPRTQVPASAYARRHGVATRSGTSRLIASEASRHSRGRLCYKVFAPRVCLLSILLARKTRGCGFAVQRRRKGDAWRFFVWGPLPVSGDQGRFYGGDGS